MDLNEYLASRGAMSLTQLRKRMAECGVVVKSNAQLRQWRHRYNDRRPDAANCVALERATNGAISRASMRPDDYWLIWPDLPHPSGSPQRSLDLRNE